MENFSTTTISLLQILRYYQQHGFETLPLLAGGKGCRVKDWQTLDPESMWQDAPGDSNVGLRAGGKSQFAILDFDDKDQPGTSEAGKRWLAGLGLHLGDYPLVRTASGVGNHVYVRFDGNIEGNYRHFTKDFGAGEFRYGPGSYVVAPPSKVNGRIYELLSGSFERLPMLSRQDLQQVVNLTKPDIFTPERPFIDLPSKSIPRSTWALLRGKGIERYRSRSEAEQAILTGLVNKGFTFEETHQLFMENPAAGKFKELHFENPSRATSWLRGSYDKAITFAHSTVSKPRELARLAKKLALSIPWPGMGGSSDRLVFIAHSDIAYHSGQEEYAASTRTLAIATGLSPQACNNATKRLCVVGLISIVRESVADRSNTYKINSQNLTLLHKGGVDMCPVLGKRGDNDE